MYRPTKIRYRPIQYTDLQKYLSEKIDWLSSQVFRGIAVPKFQ